MRCRRVNDVRVREVSGRDDKGVDTRQGEDIIGNCKGAATSITAYLRSAASFFCFQANLLLYTHRECQPVRMLDEVLG